VTRIFANVYLVEGDFVIDANKYGDKSWQRAKIKKSPLGDLGAIGTEQKSKSPL
jgi:hypothetical protein